MNTSVINSLKVLTDEELTIKQEQKGINPEVYMTKVQSNVVDSKKLLESGKLITIRPHTRFVHFPEHTHNYIEVVYMCEGSTKHKINGEEVILEKGELLFLSQLAKQEIFRADENDVAVNFIILPEFFDTTLSLLGDEESLLNDFIVGCLKSENSKIPYLHFKVAEILPVQNLVENLIWTLSNKQQNKRSINQITMGLLILQLTNHLDKVNSSVNRDNEIIIRTYEFIEENYKNGELSELADKLNYDMAWLSKTIKRLTGNTYTDLLQIKRLNQATFLLTNTKLSVNDIGYIVGYSNVSYFYRIFKKRYGVSPRDYRIENKHI